MDFNTVIASRRAYISFGNKNVSFRNGISMNDILNNRAILQDNAYKNISLIKICK